MLSARRALKKSLYKKSLRELQIELVRFQRELIETGLKVLVIFEGRDASGKDGTIKRITEHLSPRETRVVALGKPSDRDLTAWYFQRWVPHLPVSGEMVLFNRSWYNRAGVERVMRFCTRGEYEDFLRDVCPFERLLLNSGIRLIKIYLDISKDEQIERLAVRRQDPLKQWKISPIDAVAIDRWDDYSTARDEMLAATHTDDAPWTVVRANDKKGTRLNVLRHLLTRLARTEAGDDVEPPDPKCVFEFRPDRLSRLAR
jgi:polyphosphate kinase 2